MAGIDDLYAQFERSRGQSGSRKLDAFDRLYADFEKKRKLTPAADDESDVGILTVEERAGIPAPGPTATQKVAAIPIGMAGQALEGVEFALTPFRLATTTALGKLGVLSPETAATPTAAGLAGRALSGVAEKVLAKPKATIPERPQFRDPDAEAEYMAQVTDRAGKLQVWDAIRDRYGAAFAEKAVPERYRIVNEIRAGFGMPPTANPKDVPGPSTVGDAVREQLTLRGALRGLALPDAAELIVNTVESIRTDAPEIADRINQGTATKEDVATMFNDIAESDKAMFGNSFGSDVFKMIVDSAKFGVNIATAGKVVPGGAMATDMRKLGTPKTIGELGRRAAENVAGSLRTGAVQAATVGGPQVISRTIEGERPHFAAAETDLWTQVPDVDTDSNNVARRAVNNLVDQIIQYGTENMGLSAELAGKMAASKLPKAVRDKIAGLIVQSNRAIAKVPGGLHAKEMVDRGTKTLADTFAFNNLLGEWSEERAADVLGWLATEAGIDTGQKSPVNDARQYGVEALGFPLMQVLFKGAVLPYSEYRQYRARQAGERANEDFANRVAAATIATPIVQGERVDILKQRVADELGGIPPRTDITPQERADLLQSINARAPGVAEELTGPQYSDRDIADIGGIVANMPGVATPVQFQPVQPEPGAVEPETPPQVGIPAPPSALGRRTGNAGRVNEIAVQQEVSHVLDELGAVPPQTVRDIAGAYLEDVDPFARVVGQRLMAIADRKDAAEDAQLRRMERPPKRKRAERVGIPAPAEAVEEEAPPVPAVPGPTVAPGSPVFFVDGGSVGSVLPGNVGDRITYPTFAEADAVRRANVQKAAEARAEAEKTSADADYARHLQRKQKEDENTAFVHAAVNEFARLAGEDGQKRAALQAQFFSARKGDWWDKPLSEKRAELEQFVSRNERAAPPQRGIPLNFPRPDKVVPTEGGELPLGPIKQGAELTLNERVSALEYRYRQRFGDAALAMLNEFYPDDKNEEFAAMAEDILAGRTPLPENARDIENYQEAMMDAAGDRAKKMLADKLPDIRAMLATGGRVELGTFRSEYESDTAQDVANDLSGTDVSSEFPELADGLSFRTQPLPSGKVRWFVDIAKPEKADEAERTPAKAVEPVPAVAAVSPEPEPAPKPSPIPVQETFATRLYLYSDGGGRGAWAADAGFARELLNLPGRARVFRVAHLGAPVPDGWMRTGRGLANDPLVRKGSGAQSAQTEPAKSVEAVPPKAQPETPPVAATEPVAPPPASEPVTPPPAPVANPAATALSKAADALKEAAQAMSGAAPADIAEPAGITREQKMLFATLLANMEEGASYLFAVDQKKVPGLPTLSWPARLGDVQHRGYGMFSVEAGGKTLTFDGGGAMQSRAGISYTSLDGPAQELGYPQKETIERLRELVKATPTVYNENREQSPDATQTEPAVGTRAGQRAGSAPVAPADLGSNPEVAGTPVAGTAGKPAGTGERGTEAIPGREGGSGIDVLPQTAKARSGSVGGRRGSGEAGNAGRAADEPGNAAQAGPAGASEAVPEVGGQPERVAARNHRISPEDELVASGEVGKVTDNLAAIRLLRELETENREATPAEKKVLARYSGWGGIKNVLDPIRGKALVAHERGEELPAYDADWSRKWGKHYLAIERLLAQDEMQSAIVSALNAHYTTREVIGTAWDAALRLGFTGGRVGEFGAGIGHFLGLVPDAVAATTTFRAVEKDTMSGRILTKLYPEAKVKIAGLEDTPISPNSLNMVIGNFPFAKEGPYDRDYPRMSLHNYFFARAIDAVVPGGLVISVTSASTMDSPSSAKARQYIADRANLVAAIRLPNTAFKKNAGTEVVTDILILQKKGPGVRGNTNAWTQTLPMETRNAGKDANGLINVNEYYHNNPQNLLGVPSNEGKMYGDQQGGQATFNPIPGKELGDLLRDAVNRLPQNIMKSGTIAEETAVEAKAGQKPYSYHPGESGAIMQVVGNKLVSPGFSGTAEAKARSFIQIREAAKELLRMESSEIADSADVEAARKRLKKMHDAHLERFATKQQDGSKRKAWFRDASAHRHLLDDPEFCLVANLETEKVTIYKNAKGQARKRLDFYDADILTKRQNYPWHEPATAPDLNAAALIGLAYRNGITAEHIGQLLDIPATEAEQRLVESPSLFLDPATGAWTPADDYLAGNIRRKLEKATSAANEDARYQKNIAALQAAMPEPKGIDRIQLSFGSKWVPAAVYTKFLRQLTGDDKVSVESVGTTQELLVDGLAESEAVKKYSTKWAKGRYVIGETLNYRDITIFDEWEDESGNHKQKDQEGTFATRAMQKQLSEDFAEWVRTDDEAGKLTADEYNSVINVFRKREYAANEALEVYPGAVAFDLAPGKDGKPRRFVLRQHQKNAVRRILTDSALLAHAVGSGKTAIITTAAMELKRMGLARKSMIVAHNATLEQYANFVPRLYPNARVLIARKNDLDAKNRAQFLSRIALNDWDIIVVAHSSFNLIPNNPGRVKAYISSMIDDMQDVLAQRAAQEGKDSPAVRALAGRIDKELDSLKRLLDAQKDQTIFFEDLGVDALFVDEAHLYKKNHFVTAKENIKGLDTGSSKNATGLYLKTRYVHEKTGGRNVILATGTPITNTLAELWNMVRYVSPRTLEEYRIPTFDQFATAFTRAGVGLETDGAGRMRMVERFTHYTNSVELATMFQQAADVIAEEDLGHIDKPSYAGGAPELVEIEPSPVLKKITEYLVDKYKWFEGLEGKAKRAHSHVPLTIYGLGTKSTIDARLVWPTLPDDPGSKLNIAAGKIFDMWRESADDRGTQAVFMDIHRYVTRVPVGNVVDENGITRTKYQEVEKFNAWRELKRKLIEKGIPAEQVAVIDDYTTDAQRQVLFDQINAGQVRVVIGGTETLGTGVNMQERMYALHHVDAPFRPSDMEQREGRALRQGNIYPDVRVMRYGVVRTLDAGKYQMLERKQRFIVNGMTGRGGDVIEDEDDAVSYAEAAAAFSGNPLRLQQVTLQGRVRELAALRNSWQNQMDTARRNLKSNRDQVEQITSTHIPNLQAAEKDLAAKLGSDQFTIRHGNHTIASGDRLTAQRQMDAVYKELEAAVTARLLDAAEPKDGGTGNKHPQETITRKITVNGVPVSITVHGEMEYDASGKDGRPKTHGTYIIDDARMETTTTYGTATTGMGLVHGMRMLVAKIPATIEAHRATIEHLKQEIASGEKRIRTPFAYESELLDRSIELQKVEEKLRESGEGVEEEKIEQEPVLHSYLGDYITDKVFEDQWADTVDTGAMQQGSDREEDYRKVSDLFYISRTDDHTPMLVTGTAIDMIPGMDLFTYKNGLTNRWELRDGMTGKTLKAKDSLKTRESVLSMVQSAVDNGQSQELIDRLREIREYNLGWSGATPRYKLAEEARTRPIDAAAATRAWTRLERHETLNQKQLPRLLSRRQELEKVEAELRDLGWTPETDTGAYLPGMEQRPPEEDRDRKWNIRWKLEERDRILDSIRLMEQSRFDLAINNEYFPPGMTPDGRGTFYRQSKAAKGLPAAQLEQRLGRMARRMEGLGRIVVVDGDAGLPREMQADIAANRESGRLVDEWQGLYDTQTGTIYINARAHDSVRDAVSTVLHEAVGHRGLQALFGREEFARFIRNVYAVNPAVRRKADEIMEEYPDLSQKEATEEAIAWFAEKDQGIIARVIAYIRRIIRRLVGGDPRLVPDAADIADIISKARKAAEVGTTPETVVAGQTGEGYRYRAAGEAGTAPNQSDIGFYSAVEHAVANAKQDRMPGPQWLAWLKNQPGVRQEELDWMGLPQWATEHAKAVTRADVLDFIKANNVQVSEVHKAYSKDRSAEHQALAEEFGTDTEYERFQLPGGENYRELLLTMSDRTGSRAQRALAEIGSLEAERSAIHPQSVSDTAAFARIRAINARITGLIEDAEREATTFKTPHFAEPNILVHVRFNDRTDADGKRMLFIEEIQSDWHQRGRDERYKEPYRPGELRIYEDSPDIHPGVWSAKDTRGNLVAVGVDADSRDEAERLIIAQTRRFNARIPNAPFKQSWPMLAMKRMIRYAAEEGYDRIGWTTGMQQVDRYSEQLRQRVETIAWHKDRDGLTIIDIKPTEGKRIHFPVFNGEVYRTADQAEWRGRKLADVIGKEAAAKVAAADSGELSGENLTVGGEGMKGFYDAILPSEVGKYVKKWGSMVKVGNLQPEEPTNRPRGRPMRVVGALDVSRGWLIELEDGKRVGSWPTQEAAQADLLRWQSDYDNQPTRGEPIHSIDVTPAMRASVMRGQPMFRRRKGPAPKKTFTAYKLFSIIDGKPHALFISAAEPLEPGVWYDADAPEQAAMRDLAPGSTYFIAADGTATRKQYANAKQAPTRQDVNEAATGGGRLVYVGTYKNGQKRYANWGINGSGGLATYAMRPGWHATDAPSARHIGETGGAAKPQWRRADQFWAEVEIAADKDYNAEAARNPGKDIPDRLPIDGWYSFATSTNASKRQQWIITGALKINRILSDAEAAQIAREKGADPDLPKKNREAWADIRFRRSPAKPPLVRITPEFLDDAGKRMLGKPLQRQAWMDEMIAAHGDAVRPYLNSMYLFLRQRIAELTDTGQVDRTAAERFIKGAERRSPELVRHELNKATADQVGIVAARQKQARQEGFEHGRIAGGVGLRASARKEGIAEGRRIEKEKGRLLSVEYSVDKAFREIARERGVREIDWLGKASREMFDLGEEIKAMSQADRDRAIEDWLRRTFGDFYFERNLRAARHQLADVFEYVQEELWRIMREAYGRRIATIQYKYGWVGPGIIESKPLKKLTSNADGTGPQADMRKWLGGLRMDARGYFDPAQYAPKELIETYEQVAGILAQDILNRNHIANGRRITREANTKAKLAEIAAWAKVIESRTDPDTRGLLQDQGVDYTAGAKQIAKTVYGGEDTVGYSQDYTQLRQGEDAANAMQAKARREFDAVHEKFKIGDAKRWEMNNKPRKWTFGGVEQEWTDAERMEVAALWKRWEAAKKMVNNGFVRAEIAETTNPLKGATPGATSKLVAEIVATVNRSPAEKAIVEEAVRIVTAFGPEANKVSMALEGVRRFIEEHYWPMHIQKQVIQYAGADDSLINSDAMKTSLQSMSFNKDTIQHQNPVRIGSLYDTFEDHVQNMSRFTHLTLPILQITSVIQNSPELRRELAKRFGTVYIKRMREMLLSLAGLESRPRQDVLQRTVNTLTGNVSKAVLGLNPSPVIMNRVGGSLMLLPELYVRSPKALLRFLLRDLQVGMIYTENGKEDLKFLMEHGYFARRWMRDMSQVFVPIKSERTGHRKTAWATLAMRKAQYIGLAPMKHAEQENAIAAFRALVDAGFAREHARNIVAEMTRDTQNSSSALEDSQFIRDVRQSGWGGIFPFMSQTVVAKNMVVDALQDIAWQKHVTGKVPPELYWRLGMVLLAVLASSIALQQVLGMLRRRLTGSPRKHEAEQMAITAAADLVSSIVPVARLATDALEGLPASSGSVIFDRPLADTIGGARNLGTRFVEGKPITGAMIDKAVFGTLYIVGAPAGGPRFAVKVTRNIYGKPPPRQFSTEDLGIYGEIPMPEPPEPGTLPEPPVMPEPIIP